MLTRPVTVIATKRDNSLVLMDGNFVADAKRLTEADLEHMKRNGATETKKALYWYTTMEKALWLFD